MPTTLEQDPFDQRHANHDLAMANPRSIRAHWPSRWRGKASDCQELIIGILCTFNHKSLLYLLLSLTASERP